MKITKRVREEAALYCSALASSPGIWRHCHSDYEVSGDAFELWWNAYKYVRDARDADGNGREWCAEAEALLRTGWTP